MLRLMRSYKAVMVVRRYTTHLNQGGSGVRVINKTESGIIPDTPRPETKRSNRTKENKKPTPKTISSLFHPPAGKLMARHPVPLDVVRACTDASLFTRLLLSYLLICAFRIELMFLHRCVLFIPHRRE